MLFDIHKRKWDEEILQKLDIPCEMLPEVKPSSGVYGYTKDCLIGDCLLYTSQLWKGELWNHSYYVETIGSVSEENIRRYIEHQSKSY